MHFSGDIGSFEGGVMPTGLPTPPKNYPIETVIMESTYGGRVRESFEENFEKYEQDLMRDIRKYNRVVQACFSLDRLQKILYYVIDMKKRGLIPNNIPIFVDSKMGVQYIDLYIRAARAQITEKQEKKIPHQLHTNTENLAKFIDYINPHNKEYEILNSENRDIILRGGGKSIILTASGMADGGPIIEYLKRFAGDERSVFYFPGYLVPGTIGHDIAHPDEQRKIISVDGQNVEIHAKMSQKQGFSGHGDEKDLIHYLSELRLASHSNIILVHGDIQSSTLAFAHTLKREGVAQRVFVPDL